MAISKKMYSFDNEVFLHYDGNTYAITAYKAKYTTKNPKRAIEIFSDVIRDYLSLRMMCYLGRNGRNVETGCKQHMRCELCLMDGKYKNQDCYKDNPEQFYKMFNKPVDEEKQGLTSDEINKIRYEAMTNVNDGSSKGVGIGVSDG